MNKPEFFGMFFKLFRLPFSGALSSIVLYPFYCKNNETINEAKHKASSKRQRQFRLISR